MMDPKLHTLTRIESHFSLSFSGKTPAPYHTAHMAEMVKKEKIEGGREKKEK